MQNIADCEIQTRNAGLLPSLMIDCSHGNLRKDFRRQPLVVESIIEQITHGNRSITGMMLESHINEGCQSSEQLRSKMKYGVSVTDACISWETTDAVLRKLHTKIRSVLRERIKTPEKGS